MRHSLIGTTRSVFRSRLALLVALLLALLTLAAARPHEHDGSDSSDSLRAAAAHHHGAGAPSVPVDDEPCALCTFLASPPLFAPVSTAVISDVEVDRAPPFFLAPHTLRGVGELLLPDSRGPPLSSAV